MADHYQTIPNTINRLRAYGCSHTAGEEISDHSLLWLSIEECNHHKSQSIKKRIPWMEYEHNGKTIHQIFYDGPINIDKLNKSKSFPAKLAEQLNLSDYVNKSHGGNSQMGIYNQIVSDHINGIINQNDLIVIGCTLPYRFLFLSNSLNKSYQLSTMSEQHMREVLKWQPSETFIWNFYNSLLLIKNYIQTHNLNAIMIPTEASAINPASISQSQYKNDINWDQTFYKYVISVWEQLRQSIMITGKGLDNFGSQYGDTPLGHWLESTHQKFADHIISKLKIV